MADEEKESSGVWYGILDAALKMPGARVDRTNFLEKEFAKHNGDELSQILDLGPGKAGIPLADLTKIADGAIRSHTTVVTGTSFLAGLPGGIAMAGTIPADLAQYYYHVIVIAQKLAYIYGWPDLQVDSQGETDREAFLSVLTIFIGIMSGAKEANSALQPMTDILRKESTRKLPVIALAKIGLPQIAKQVAKVLGANLAKQGLAKGIGKIVPLIGGAISGAVTIATFLPMANTLRDELQNQVIK
ncbi:MAG: hypothetical protein LBD74_03730 [Spirochaetaceae bacterium]|jgi:uncharacterized membrane protein|nr:hypothetical protein [Spirochaetaceae bacterium]